MNRLDLSKVSYYILLKNEIGRVSVWKYSNITFHEFSFSHEKLSLKIKVGNKPFEMMHNNAENPRVFAAKDQC